MNQKTTTFAITSGKGGVGKSIVAINMAETLSDMGYQVALIDLDFGQSNCSVLLNEHPKSSLLEYANHTALKDHILHRTEAGITLVQGASHAVRTQINARSLLQVSDELIRSLQPDHDYIILDTPAGTGETVRWALDRASMGILVLVGEPTAIADAYQLARMVWELDPDYPIKSVVNFADTEAEAHSVADRFGKVTTHFTGNAARHIGWVPFSSLIRKSVNDQYPAVRIAGPVRNAFRAMAKNLLNEIHSLPIPMSLN